MIEIKTVISDVDGSLTDGGVYYFDNWQRARKFSTFDGEGVALLKERGIYVVLMTASSAEEIKHRALWLDVPVRQGIKDKAEFVSNNFTLENTAYFGNDTNDLEAMKKCAFAGCPADAHEDVHWYCQRMSQQAPDLPFEFTQHYPVRGFVSTRNGGEGAFRQFADMLISNKFKFSSHRELFDELHGLNR
jgi:YrbI family 3-deoxy-D-manno-octulosonate 8-phosphate phosphatase